MKWTKEKPTVPGWWWNRQAGFEPVMAFVWPDGVIGIWPGAPKGFDLSPDAVWTSEWQGPIHPEE